MNDPHILPMQIDTVATDTITEFPGNPRQGNLAVLKQSLAHNGQYRPLIVQTSTGHVIAGNNTLHAARDAGWADIAVQWLDVTDEQARRINLADNRSNDKATYDDRLLAEMLESLPNLDGTGYEPYDLDTLATRLDPPDFGEFAEFTEAVADTGTASTTDTTNTKQQVTCPNCEHEFTP